MCFFDHGIELERFELPPTDHRRIEVGGQGTFRSAYLDKAVSFMLGSIEADGHYFECSHGAHQPGEPSKPLPPVNGLSVRTPTVPDIGPGITFLWGP